MKTNLFFLLLIFSSVALSEPLKVVFHINEFEKANLLIFSVNELIHTKNNIDIKLVMHGSSILKLSKNDSLRKKFERLMKQGVEIGVCSQAMLQNKLKPGMIIEGVNFLTQGGLIRIIQLQNQGYRYIKI
jgi:intracellular sulfur oxidation DsrE/DsrF family protein